MALKNRKLLDDNSRKQRRSLRTLLLLVVFIFAASAFLLARLSAAWQETQRREAYLPQLEEMARQSPSDGRLLALLGGRLTEAGEYDAAIETLRRAIAAGDQDDDVWLTMAAARAAAGDSHYAMADFLLALKAHPDSPALQVARIRVQSLGKRSTPEALAKAICPAGTGPLIASLSQGSGLNRFADWWGQRHLQESGFATREAWVKQRPDDAEAQRLWGEALLKNRRLPEAGRSLNKALLLAPNSPDANVAMADFMQASGAHSRAVFQYFACLKLRPDWLRALLGLGQSALHAKMTKYALQAYQRATEVAPQSPEAWIGLGRAGVVLWTRHSQSLSAFETASRLAPERTDFFDDYAIAIREDGFHNIHTKNYQAKALSVIRRRLAAAPEDSEAHYLLANILLCGPLTPSVTAEVEKETRKALEISPGQPQAQIQLAKLLLCQGNTSGSIDLLKKALVTLPNDAHTLTILAQAYSRAGQTDQAKTLFEKIKKLNDLINQLNKLQDREEASPLDGTLHERLATLYSQLGQMDKAYAEHNMAQLIRENPQEVARQRASLQILVRSSLKEN